MAKRKAKSRQTTMNISMPASLRAEIDTAMREEGFANVSEFVRHVVRTYRTRPAPSWLEDMVEEGLAGPFERADDAWWTERSSNLESAIKAGRRTKRKIA